MYTKFHIDVQDPLDRPICPKVGKPAPRKPQPAVFRRKKQFDRITTSIYNSNYRSMPDAEE